MKLKGLSIGGGALKISGEYGILKKIYPEYKPDYIAAVSAGAILAFVLPTLEVRDYNLYGHFLTNIKDKDLWKTKPLTKNGGFSASAVLRAIAGYSSFGDMSNLKNTLRKIVSEERFNRYIVNGREKGIFVGSVCYNTGHRAFIDLKKCKYEEAINWVLASSSIPVYTEPYEYNKYFYYDGGVRDHNPGSWLIEEFGKDLEQLVSIYSRPKDYNMIDQNWKPSNIYKVLERTLEIMQIEISKSNEIKELLLSEKNNIKLDQLFLPNVLESLYDTDSNRLLKLYVEGCIIGEEWKFNNKKNGN